MHVKIGNIAAHLLQALIFFAPMCSAQSANLQLRIVSAQGQPLKNVVAGAPCMVEVIIPGQQTLYKRPIIAGLDAQRIMREQESSQVSLINGVRTQQRTISYVTTFEQPGVYTLGPARVETAQGELFSGTVSLEVLEHATTQTTTENFVSAEIKFEKRAAYVGQAIPYTVSFYYSDDAVQYVNMSPLQIADALVVPSDVVQRGTATIKNNSCNVLIWSGIIYPQKPGPLAVPACHFDYQEPQTQPYRSQWAQFMQLFQHATVQKRVSTQRTTLAIQSLPAYHKNSCGVGSIRSVTATLSPDTFAQGESAVLTVRIEGNAHMPSVVLPPLHIPDALRVYESKVTTSGEYPNLVKSYEYIVQGLQPGNWQIPAQEYTFFDPRDAAYKNFTTQASMVYVMPLAGIAAQTPPEHMAVQETENNNDLFSGTVESIAKNSVHQRTPPLIPFSLFIILLLIPPVWWATKNYWYWLVQRWQFWRKYKKAACALRQTVQKYPQHKDPVLIVQQWNHLMQVTALCMNNAAPQELCVLQHMQQQVDALAFGAKAVEDYQAFLEDMERALRICEKRVRRGAA